MEKKFFSFLFNTEFYCGISKETMTMLFRGLTILKSPKLIIKGGLCYGFAMVYNQSPGGIIEELVASFEVVITALSRYLLTESCPKK